MLLSQIVGYVGTVVSLISVQQKKMMNVLILGIFCNFLSASSNFLIGGFSGGCICVVALLQTVVSLLLERKQKRMPVWGVVIFIAAYIGITALTYESWHDIFPCVGACMFALAIIQKQSSRFRFFMVLNAALWIIYELTLTPPNYAMAVTFVLQLISTVIGIIRLDLLKKPERKS